jgi:hypothetical protein
MQQTRTSALITGFIVVTLLLFVGCGAPERAPEPDPSTATSSTINPDPTPIPPTPTVVPPTNTPQPPPPTPTATPPIPTTLISLAAEVPDWAAGKMELKVVSGSYQVQGGTTIRAGSQIYVFEDWLKYPVGLMIDVGNGGVTLGGTPYPEGTKLYAFEVNKLKKVN